MINLILGDCIEKMQELEACSVDTVITDPPYGLNFMGKDWDKFSEGKNPAGGTKRGTPYQRNRVAPSFFQYTPEQMATLQGFSFAWATEALRIAKPGAFMLCFGGTRTFHRVACGIEDAGWILRDTIMWVYGSGFPKSYNISKGIDKKLGAERENIPNPLAKQQTGQDAGKGLEGERNQNLFITVPATDQAKLWDGWGTALKPAFEPIIVAMKPLDGTNVENALKWGVAGLNIDGGRVGTEEYLGRPKGQEVNAYNRSQYIEKMKGEITSEPEGRFPANFIHDGSEEVLAGFPKHKAGKMVRNVTEGARPFNNNGEPTGYTTAETINDPGGSAARFFYCAKASKAERNAGLEGMEAMQQDESRKEGNPGGDNPRNRGVHKRINNHPTVKPLSLMVYLCKLTKTPTGGVVLDPFMGSGTTGMACKKTGRDFIGIEKDEHFFEIATKRIENMQIQKEMF